MREALGGHHHDRGAPALAHLVHHTTADGVEGDRVPAVSTGDGNAEEVVNRPERCVVERAPRGVGGDGVAVVLDPEQHGHRKACGVADSLHYFALLRGAVADTRHHDGGTGLRMHLACHANCVKQAIARGHGHGHHMQVGVVEEGRHLASRRIGLGSGQQTMEKAHGLEAARDEQRARPVVRLQPVLWPKMVGEYRRCLVPGAAQLEERLAPLHQFGFNGVNPAGPEHGAQRVEGTGGVWGGLRGQAKHQSLFPGRARPIRARVKPTIDGWPDARQRVRRAETPIWSSSARTIAACELR